MPKKDEKETPGSRIVDCLDHYLTLAANPSASADEHKADVRAELVKALDAL